MAYCENIVIGHPLVDPKELLSLNDKDSLQTILKQFGKRISGDNFEINNSTD